MPLSLIAAGYANSGGMPADAAPRVRNISPGCRMEWKIRPVHADKSCLTRWIAKFQGGAFEQPVDPRLLLERWEAEDAAMSAEEAYRNRTN